MARGDDGKAGRGGACSGSHLAKWQGGDLECQCSFCKLSTKPPASALLSTLAFSGSRCFPILSLSRFHIKIGFLSLIPSYWLLPSADMQLSTILNLLSMLPPLHLLFSFQSFVFLSHHFSPFSCSCRFTHFKFLYCEVLHRSEEECIQSVVSFLRYIYLFINIPPN